MGAPVLGAAAVMQAIGTYGKGRDDARALRQQADVASQQAYADEAAQRRDYSQLAGQQAAAIAQNGGGAGGTNDYLVAQSELNAMVDALTIRYSGSLRRAGLLAEAKSTKKSAKYLAGAHLLQGGGKYLESR